MVVLATLMRSTVVYGYYGYGGDDSYSRPPNAPIYKPSTAWLDAHATFYGDETASETMGGACGYGNLHNSGYGLETAALSSVMFKNGDVCGACYEIKCVESKWCYKDAANIKITATNLCPPNWYQPTDAGGWCNPPRSHFDLSKPMFMKIAEWTAGIVPIKYRRQWRHFENVGKRERTGWMIMNRNWGAAFEIFCELQGQALSFKVKNGAGHTLVDYNVAPADWSTGQTYKGNINFY
ncbi:Expansin-A7 [Bienertia sinuspersici]